MNSIFDSSHYNRTKLTAKTLLLQYSVDCILPGITMAVKRLDATTTPVASSQVQTKRCDPSSSQ
jgi:hypothetical protein